METCTSNFNGGCVTLIGLTQGCQHAKMYRALSVQLVTLRGERGTCDCTLYTCAIMSGYQIVSSGYMQH